MTTPHTDRDVSPGATGAKRQSWKRANPRDVLKRIIDDNPGMTEGDIQERCWHILQSDQQQLRTIFEYWFANNYRSLTLPSSPRSPTAAKAASSGSAVPAASSASPSPARGASSDTSTLAAAIDKKLDDHIEEKVKLRVTIVLRHMMLPHGKTVAQSTREELLEIGTDLHGFTQRVAERLAPGQTVDEAGLSEEDLKVLYAEPPV